MNSDDFTEKSLLSEIQKTLKLNEPEHPWNDIILISVDGTTEKKDLITSGVLRAELIGDGKIGWISPICLPCFEEFGFPGIYLFCDDGGSSKKLPINQIATNLYQFGRCSFKYQIKGRVALFSETSDPDLLQKLIKIVKSEDSINQIKKNYQPVEINPSDEVLLKLLMSLYNKSN